MSVPVKEFKKLPIFDAFMKKVGVVYFYGAPFIHTSRYLLLWLQLLQ